MASKPSKAAKSATPPEDETIDLGGRPSSYDPKYAELVSKICMLGATDTEIADFFDVSVRTIHRWKLQHPEFCHAIKSGKEIVDERVERSLFQRASGYAYVEQQAFKVKSVKYENGKRVSETEEIKVVDVERQAPPDTTAAIFWMKNRRSEDWRDVHKHEHGKPGDFDNMGADELRDFCRGEAEALGLGHAPAKSPGRTRAAGGQLN
jgi:hypothetical protein